MADDTRSHEEHLIRVLEGALKTARNGEIRSAILVSERFDDKMMIGIAMADGHPERILMGLRLVTTDLELRTLEQMVGFGEYSQHWQP